MRGRTVAGDLAAMERLNVKLARRSAAATSEPTAPYWLDYLARERTMCSICHKDGKGWVRIGPPIPPGMSTKRGVMAAHRNRQRVAMMLHVSDVHPTLKVRWQR